MLKIFVCDDETVHRNRITKIVKNYLMMMDYDIEFAMETPDPNDVLTFIRKERTEGLYFLDIDLNAEMNGIMLGAKIREYDPTAKIVFITSYSDMAYLTFVYKVEAMDYLVKDDFEELQKKVISCIDTAMERYMNTELPSREQIRIKSGVLDIKLFVDEILFFDSSQTPHKLIIHLDNRMVEYTGKIKDVEKFSQSFYRCHQSYVVNVNNISRIDKKERVITMVNDEECLVSTRHLKKLVDRFNQK